MNDEERRGLIQSQILERLSFMEQLEREHHIEDAHVKPFRLILQDPRDKGKPWSDFVAWMERDDDHLYWMTGKPGSGKSTMMKYVVHQSGCTRSLKTWTKNLPLVITSFYFRSSGSADQMSQESLLQSILHDAISQQRQILPMTLPHRYQRALFFFGCDLRPWTLEKLQQSFKRLVAAAAANKFKLCMFVDGLDEFDGDLTELVDVFKMAMLHQNVKACVASRPWNVFEEAFMYEPGLRLEDITYPDIVAYIKSHLDSNSGFNVLRRREPGFASILVENIAKKSSGVFLWVDLVVRSLLSGLSNCDRLSDLQRRLDWFPSVLEDFYKNIFPSIELFYREHAYQLFRLVEAGRGRLTALGLSFADEEPDVALQASLDLASTPLDDSEKLDRYEQVRRRLNASCKGFLELPSSYDDIYETIVVSEPRTPDEDDNARGSKAKRSLPLRGYASEHIERARRHRGILFASNEDEDHSDLRNQLRGKNSPRGLWERKNDKDMHESSLEWVEERQVFGKVAYLHRSVRDFLAGEEIAGLINRTTASFCPDLALLCSNLHLGKTWESSFDVYFDRRKLGMEALSYAATQESVDTRYHDVLDELGRILSFHQICVFQDRPKPKTFLEAAALHGLHSYVSAKILRGTMIYAQDDERSLFYGVVKVYRSYPSFQDPKFRNLPNFGAPPCIRIIRHLLCTGNDPNRAGASGKMPYASAHNKQLCERRPRNMIFDKRSYLDCYTGPISSSCSSRQEQIHE